MNTEHTGGRQGGREIGQRGLEEGLGGRGEKSATPLRRPASCTSKLNKGHLLPYQLIT